jgi:hypothetical protein
MRESTMREPTMRAFFSLIGLQAAPDPWQDVFLRERRFRHWPIKDFSATVLETSVDPLGAVRLILDLLSLLHENTPHGEVRSVPWSLVVTGRDLLTAREEQTRNTIPAWVLIEFHNSILIEETVLGLLRERAPDIAGPFSPCTNGLYSFRWNAPTPKREPELPTGHLDNGPNAPSQSVEVVAESFADLVSKAGHVYQGGSLPRRGDLGGLNALVLLSAEKAGLSRGVEPRGRFILYNMTALGLSLASDPNSLSTLVEAGKIQIDNVVAEP